MKDDILNSKEMYERSREKSVGEDKKVRYVKMRKDEYIARLKTMFIVGSIAAIIATSGVIYGFSTLADMHHTSIIVAQQVGAGRQLVNENTKRTNDNQHYYYETFDIAMKLTEDPKNFDNNLYGVYSEIGYNKTNKLEQMEDVVSSVGGIVSSNKENIGINYYKDFTDYLVKKGFVKEDGTIDLNAYEESIRNQMVKEAEIKNLQEEVNNFKTR